MPIFVKEDTEVQIQKLTTHPPRFKRPFFIVSVPQCLCLYGQLWYTDAVAGNKYEANQCNLFLLEVPGNERCLNPNTTLETQQQSWIVVQTHNDGGIHCHQNLGAQSLDES